VELSLSLTAPPSKTNLIKILEPNASPLVERIKALQAAKKMGIPVYGILCPCLPGVADTSDTFGELLDIMLSLEPTAIWTEPVNPRGPGLKNCAEHLARHGLFHEANQLHAIRNRHTYSKYVHQFIETATTQARRRNCLEIFNILIYDNGQDYNDDDQAVIWLK
jgi:DNA repair photolyase